MYPLSLSKERFHVLEIGKLRYNRYLLNFRGKLAKANLHGGPRLNVMYNYESIDPPSSLPMIIVIRGST